MPAVISTKQRGSANTIFGRLNAKNITFLIDISGSMYRTLDDVKEHLIRAITEKSLREYDSMFNILAFSDEVYPWASSLMPCTSRTVTIATEWIRKLESKSSTNTQDALLLALQDPGTDAIYLVTDGLPNDKPSIIMKNVTEVLNGRSIHCFYISGSKDDNPAIDFLRRLADISGGSLKLLTLDRKGSINELEDIYSDDTSLLSSVDSEKAWFQDENKYNRYQWRRDEDSNRKNKHLMNGIGLEEGSNLAASLMIGKRVLARRENDGFYYLGTVINMIHADIFEVRFDDCLALYPHQLEQKVPLQNMISYEAALRSNVNVGEKVLVPLKDDGRYGPGTVVEDIGLNKTEEDKESVCYAVSTYDGQTIEIPYGVAVKISEDTYKLIRNEIFLPESFRKGMTNGRDVLDRKAYFVKEEAKNGLSRKHRPKGGKRLDLQEESDDESVDFLKSRIERQIEEGEILLQKLYLEDEEYARELGYAPSVESDSYESTKRLREKANIDEESFTNWRERVLADAFRSTPTATRKAWLPIEEPEEKASGERKLELKPALKHHNKDEGYHKHRLELLNHWEKHKHSQKYSPYIMNQIPTPPKGVEKATQSTKTSSKPRSQKKITFRITTLKSNNQPKVRRRHIVEPRPTSNEYHAFDGIPFPPSADRKFKSQAPTESWTIERAGISPAQPMNIITNRPIEYWQKDRNGVSNDTRSASLDGTRNAAWEKRQQDIANDRARKERIFKERQEYNRMTIEKRENERRERVRKFKEGEELNRQQSRAVRENFIRYQKEKEDKAQRYKQERLDAMRERRLNKSIEDTNRERSIVEAREKIQEGHSVRENHRRKAFESSLDSEIKMQEKKLERLRKIHASRLNKEDTRTARAFNSRDLRDHVQDQSRQIYRASIIP